MVHGYRVVVVSPATNLKHLKVLISHVLNSRAHIDKYILLRPDANDAYMSGYLASLEIEHPDFFEVRCNLGARSFEPKLAESLVKISASEPDTYFIYLDEKVCYLHPSAVPALVKYAIQNEEYPFVHPAMANTERTTYLYQVIKHAEPWLTKWWDISYIDDINFASTDPAFHVYLHERFLEAVDEQDFSSLDFVRYILKPKDKPQNKGFCWLGGRFQNLTTKEMEQITTVDKFLAHPSAPGCIIASALASYYGYKQHLAVLDATEILERYRQTADSSTSFSTRDFSTNVDSVSEYGGCVPVGALFADDGSEFRINFAISTHVSTEHITLPVLLPSLYKDNDIPKENILVVVGGAKKDRLEKKDGILYSYVSHNSFDHNAIIDIVDKGFGGEWWFTMHDTAKAGPNFYKKVLKYGPSADHICVLDEGWLNMGLFSRRFLQQIRPYIMNLKNINKMQAILSEKLYPRMVKASCYDSVPNMVIMEKGDIYGDNVERQVLYFSLIDLYKYQSFHYASEATRRCISEWIMREDVRYVA